MMLERMAHCEPEVDLIARRDLKHVIRCPFSHCPESGAD
jgi:hypothetical protein